MGEREFSKPADEKFSMSTAVAMFVAIVCIMLAAIAYPRGEFVLVVANPSTSEAGMMTLIAEAGGSFVSTASLPWLAVAHADGEGFAGRLLTSGAFLVVDHALAAGCLERT